jgi:Ca-activated chloride channel family protein
MIAPFISSLWPHWLRPFWWLLLPLLLGLLWLLAQRKKRHGRWQELLPEAFHSTLLRANPRRASRLPWMALGLAWLLALLALLGPGWQRVEQNDLKPADPLVVLLELTPQLLASDASPNRLAQARRKLLDLLRARGDAQTAIVVYAGSAHTLVPLSDDLQTSQNLLQVLKPSLMPEPGKRADLALGKALQLLHDGALGSGRLLLITSTLTSAERQGIRQQLHNRDERLLILGIGTDQGAPMVEEDGTLLKDDQGVIMIPRRDSSGLSQFAQELGGRYQNIRQDEGDLRDLGLLENPPRLLDSGHKSQLRLWADQGHWLLLPLLLLAACAGRRGWLLCLPLLLLCTPQRSLAWSLDDLWLRADQQGQRLLQAQRPEQAAKRFEDPQWRGLALYQAGDYAAAAEQFAQGDNAVALYNRGNALARSNELEAALESYERALQLAPDLLPAQKNKALLEALLRQRKDSQQGDQGARDRSDDHSQAQAQDGAPPPEAAQQTPREPSAVNQETTAQADQPAEQKAPGASPGTALRDTPDAPRPADPRLDTAEPALDSEHMQAMEQWLRQIPDDPGELLRRKFRYEQLLRQESSQ